MYLQVDELKSDELMNYNMNLELVDSVVDKDLDVLTSLINSDVCPFMYARCLLDLVCEVG